MKRVLVVLGTAGCVVIVVVLGVMIARLASIQSWAGITAVVGLTTMAPIVVMHTFTVRKLQLEIARLKQQEADAKSPVVRPTEEQIAKYARRVRNITAGGGGVLLVMITAGIIATQRPPEEAAASEEDVPAKVEHLLGDTPTRVTLTEDAAKRLDLQTALVREVLKPTRRLIIPYAALLYDTEGNTWVYVSTAPLVFTRHHVVVDRISGEDVIATEGPQAGTAVVVVGAEELFGAELEFEEE